MNKTIIPQRFIGDDEIVCDAFRPSPPDADRHPYRCRITHKPTNMQTIVGAMEIKTAKDIGKRILEANILNSDSPECVKYVDELKVVMKNRNMFK